MSKLRATTNVPAFSVDDIVMCFYFILVYFISPESNLGLLFCVVSGKNKKTQLDTSVLLKHVVEFIAFGKYTEALPRRPDTIKVSLHIHCLDVLIS